MSCLDDCIRVTPTLNDWFSSSDEIPYSADDRKDRAWIWMRRHEFDLLFAPYAQPAPDRPGWYHLSPGSGNTEEYPIAGAEWLEAEFRAWQTLKAGTVVTIEVATPNSEMASLSLPRSIPSAIPMDCLSYTLEESGKMGRFFLGCQRNAPTLDSDGYRDSFISILRTGPRPSEIPLILPNNSRTGMLHLSKLNPAFASEASGWERENVHENLRLFHAVADTQSPDFPLAEQPLPSIRDLARVAERMSPEPSQWTLGKHWLEDACARTLSRELQAAGNAEVGASAIAAPRHCSRPRM
ncbi:MULTISPECIES: hypothetical protein [unclassified Thioalkalivibrio]|uniref:hypothetical protein n=1 Tax=unclassified Thioalkalivibrio TaxID=2621013 RepID=UPI00035E2EB2|nr:MULTISPECIES: hypothetical protein [unclassified Thioalkalivibrio]